MEGSETAGQERLVDLLEYQKSSIVSREIIGRQTGTITLFAFDKGQGLSPHSAPFDAFVYLAEGRAEVAIEDERHVLADGDMIVMPAHRQHAIKALEPFKMLLVMIRS
ncbi:MAG: cupin domain-containing protein [Syntrophorhabdales bacterium]|jgi:quercetin dioxygenase-like cupin family protein